MKGIGLCGAHRTGKTTLAIAVSAKHRIPFTPISTTQVFRDHGFEPNQVFSIEERIKLQFKVLTHAVQIWEKAVKSDNLWICDRTPIDMAGYLLADVTGHNLSEPLEELVSEYLYDCFQFTNLYFDYLAIVPPMFPLVVEEGKGYNSTGYRTKLHYLILGLVSGLTSSPRAQVIATILSQTDLDLRVKEVMNIIF